MHVHTISIHRFSFSSVLVSVSSSIDISIAHTTYPIVPLNPLYSIIAFIPTTQASFYPCVRLGSLDASLPTLVSSAAELYNTTVRPSPVQHMYLLARPRHCAVSTNDQPRPPNAKQYPSHVGFLYVLDTTFYDNGIFIFPA